ncbi:hypothetical protein, partial [Methylobacter tundripaludum]
MNTGKLKAAADARAALYEGDDRQDIKTDVVNAFYAGANFAASEEREACADKSKGHILLTPQTCGCDKRSETPCPVCDWGLAVCANCGAAESELDAPCTYSEAGT